MKYELLVETETGEWINADLGEYDPALVFQINDLNELKDINFSYSQAIELPMTPNNVRIFGHANVFEAKSQEPYKVKRCELYCDDILIVDRNYKLVLEGVTDDEFICQIASNGFSLLDKLKNLSMSDLEALEPFYWDAQDIRQVTLYGDKLRKYFVTAAHIDSETKSTSFIMYPTLEYNSDLRLESMLIAACVYPYYNIIGVIETILEAQGFTLETDAKELEGNRPLYFSLPELNAQEDSFHRLKVSVQGKTVSANSNSTFPLPLTRYIANSNTYYNEWNRNMLYDPEKKIVGGIEAFEYISPGYMKILFEINTTGNGARVCYKIRRHAGNSGYNKNQPNAGNEIIEEFENSIDEPKTEYKTDIIEIYPGDRIFIDAYLLGSTESKLTNYSIKIDTIIPKEENKIVTGGCKVYPALSTGFKTQYDFFKMFTQLYGLSVSFDYENKVVKAYSFNKLYKNINDRTFYDWSHKIDIGKTKRTDFELNSYGNKSRILFQPMNHAPAVRQNFQDAGILEANNANLSEIKDLFTLPFESGFNSKPDLLSSGNYYQYTFESSARQEFKYGDWIYVYNLYSEFYHRASYFIHKVKPITAKPRVIRASTEKLIQPWNIDILPYKGPGYSINCPIGVALTGEGLIELAYQAFEKILNPIRVITAYFNLTPVDIQNLDLMKPVYIEYYGEYFYIQKIENFQVRKLTKCVLVSLNTTS